MKRIIFLLAILYSCESKNDDRISSRYKIEFKDTLFANTVRQYIDEYKVQKNKSIIIIEKDCGGDRETFFIDQEVTPMNEYSHIPSFYSFVDNYLVFIYTDIDLYVKQVKAEDEILAVIDSMGFDFDYKEGRTAHPPYWEVTRCNGQVTILKDSLTEFRHVPCGYQLLRHRTIFDSLIFSRQ